MRQKLRGEFIGEADIERLLKTLTKLLEEDGIIIKAADIREKTPCELIQTPDKLFNPINKKI